MSFILDALRKSEHDRQRQAGPGLAEVAVARAGSRTRMWATAAVVLLLVNLLVVGMLLLRNATREPSAGPGAPAGTAAVAGTTDATSPPRPAPRREVPPMLRPATDAPPAAAKPGERNALEAELPVPPERSLASVTQSRDVALPPEPAVRPATTPPRSRGKVVYETEPLTGPDPSPAAAATRALPSADDLIAQGGLPPLHLDLHVYAGNPAERFVFVNTRKYREGETLQEGPTIEEITRDGAVLSYRGNRFVLGRP